MFFQQYIKWRVSGSGDVDVLHQNRKCFFRHVHFDSGFHVMAINEISRNRPENILGFRNISCWVILKRVWTREFVWFSSKNFLFLSSFRMIPDQSGWSQTSISSMFFDCSICNWEFKIVTFYLSYHFLCIKPSGADSWCVHLLQLFNVCDHNVSFPDSPRIQYITENIPGKTFGPCNFDMSFAEIRWYSPIAPNGITGPLQGIPNRLSYGVFPTDKRSWMFRRWQ